MNVFASQFGRRVQHWSRRGRLLLEPLEPRVLLSVSFPGQVFGVASAPRGMASADLNGDGLVDLAVGSSGSAAVSVLLADGRGTFGACQEVATPDSLYSVASADFDGDGCADLATANGLGNAVSVLLGNGDGSFHAPVDYAVGQDARGLAAVDLNEDGHPDLAVTNYDDGTVSILLGNGDGTFADQQVVAVGQHPVDVTTADLNADEHADLVTADNLSRTASVLLGNGDGTFAGHVEHALTNPPLCVAAVDLNEDGALDLAAGSNWSSLNLLLGNGDGSFQGAQELAVASSVWDIHGADLDGDGHADLIASSTTSGKCAIWTLLGNGNATFQDPVATYIGAACYALNPGDHDGNGDVDVAAAVEGSPAAVVVLRGLGDGTLSPPSYPTTDRADSVTGADFDGDGAIDLATAASGDDGVSVLLNDGGGAFPDHQHYGVGDMPAAIASGDFDGDGAPDLVTANERGDSVSVLLNNGDGIFGDAVAYAVGDHPDSVVAADFNSDSKLDLATASETDQTISVLLGSGDGTFQSVLTSAAGLEPLSLFAADLDGDGAVDLAATNPSDRSVTVLLGNDNGTFTVAGTYLVCSTSSQVIQSICGGDFDGDGAIDLATVSYYYNTESLSVLLGNGDGTFQAKVDYGVTTHPSQVVVTDLDADGVLDLAVSGERDGRFSVLLGRGDGTFAEHTEYGGGHSPGGIFGGDLDGDGVGDVVLPGKADSAGGWVTVYAGELGFSSRIDMPVRSGEILEGDSLWFAGTGAASREPLSSAWDFGDGRSSTVEDPGYVTFRSADTFDVSFAVVDGSGMADPDPASLTLTVVADPGTAPDLVVDGVDVPDDLAIGAPAQITYAVSNRGDGALSGATWHDAIYLSTDQHLDAGDQLLGSSGDIGEELDVGGSYDGVIEVTIPQGTVEGAWYLILSVDDGWEVLERHQANNESAAAIGLLIPRLEPGVPLAATFTEADRHHYYRVDVAAGESLVVTLEDANGEGVNELYARFGELPTRGTYDQRHFDPTGADQRVVVPAATPGTWYLLVRGASLSESSDYTVTAEPVGDFALLGVNPRQIVDFVASTLTLTGVGFQPGASVELVAADDTAYPAASVSVDSSTQITAQYGAFSLPEGVYTARVVVAGGAARELADAVEVFTSGEAVIETRLVLPGAVGFHGHTTLYVEYTNTGNRQIAAPLLVLTGIHGDSAQALLTLSAAASSRMQFWETTTPPGLSNTVYILASGDTPGLLQPGESGRVPVYYAGVQLPWHFDDAVVEFTLSVTTSDNTQPADWDVLGEGLCPEWLEPDAWGPVWDNFEAEVGTDWGDYVAMLTDNAAYLGRLGASVWDAADLYAFELRQADGLSPWRYLAEAVDVRIPAPGLPLEFGRAFAQGISRRCEPGPFGRGWTHNWQWSLEEGADGVVTITDTTGTARAFVPQHFGGYASPVGWPATLTDDGSIFVLQQPDGTEYVFNTDGTLDYQQDPNGNRITAGYTGDLLTSLTHSCGLALQIDYDVAGHIECITDPYGRQTVFAYDAAGEHLVSVEAPDERTTTYTYLTDQGSHVEHALTQVEFPDGSHRTFTYDELGWLAETYRDGEAERLTYSYDGAGTVYETNALGATTTYWFDMRGAVLQTEDPLGNVVHYGFDEDYDLVQLTGPLGRSFVYTHDELGNVTSLTDPLGQVVELSYDGLSRTTSATDANGNITIYTYDADGNLIEITYPDHSGELYARDDEGKLTEWTNRRGDVISYTYDAVGRLVRKDYSGGAFVEYGVDAHGDLTSASDGTDDTLFHHDANDRLARIDYPDGQFLELTYDSAGRRASSTDQLGHEVNYHYDAVGRLERLTDGTGADIVGYTYDAAGRLARKDLGNGTYTAFDYDNAGRLLSLITRAPDASVLASFEYSHDALGLRTGTLTPDGEWTYEYDVAGRLTRAVFDSTNGAIPDQEIAYSYDAAGSRAAIVVSGVTLDYTTNNLNAYTDVGNVVYEYDAEGNLTREIAPTGTTTYTYDEENRLLTIDSPEGARSYLYDALGICVGVVENGVESHFVVDPIGLCNVVSEYDAEGDLVAHYDYGFGLVSRVDAAGDASYYAFDAVGSTALLTDSAAGVVNSYVYGPFGESLLANETVSSPFEYIGEWGVMAAADGLCLMRARSYDPATGRFQSQDPLEIWGGNTNLYTYVYNNPVSFVDPLGEGFYCGEVSLSDPPGLSFGFSSGYSVGASLGLSAGVSAGASVGVGPGGTAGPAFNAGLLSAGAGFSAGAQLALSYGWSMGESYGWSYGISEGWFCGWQFDDAPTPPTEGAPGGSSGAVASSDPNAKTGPVGFGDPHYVAPGTTLAYRIDFENEEDATAPAQYVTVSDQLDADLDWTTLELIEVGFGAHLIPVPGGTQFFETVVPMTCNGADFEVHIEIDFDPDTGLLEARFVSLDPDTGLPPDVLIGFLPPEDGSGRGQGHVSYVIEHDPGLPTGTEIRNIAVIQFDFGEIIATNQVDPHDPGQGTDPAKEAFVTIDADLPQSQVTALAATTAGPEFRVDWAGQDGTSGVGSYDVYVSTDGGAWEVWLDDADAIWAFYPGDIGHTYAFYSLAADNVGHLETQAAQADTQTTVTTAFTTPGGVDVDMDVYSGVQLNVTGPASTSLGIDSLDPGTNPPTALFAIRIGADPQDGWLRFVDAGGRADLFPDGTGPEWHSADDWAGKRLRGLATGTAYTLHVRAGDGLGGASPAMDSGTYTTNLDCDVNRSGLTTALDYALIRGGELRGGELGVGLPWCLDVDGDGDVDTEDRDAARSRILNPQAPVPPAPQAPPPVPVVARDALTSGLLESGSATAYAAEEGQSPRSALAQVHAFLAKSTHSTTRTRSLDRDGDGDVDRDDILAAENTESATGGE